MREYEECEYCWKRATRQRFLPGDGRYAYCRDHAPADAGPIRYDTDGSRIRMDGEQP
jgi:hypothetical protein